MKKRIRAFKAPLVIGALACGVLAAWGAGLGSSALADTVTGTTGDISYSVTWTQGPGPNQTTLVVSNTASSSGQPISDFDFQINDPSADVTTTSGGGCSTNGVTPNEVTCGNALYGGQTETITITTQNPIATGTTATITFRDGAENPQPAVTVGLQGSSTTTTGTTTTGSTSTGTTTTGTTSTGTTSTGTTSTGTTSTGNTSSGACDWSVAIDFSGAALVDGRWVYTVTVTNKGAAPCPGSSLSILLRPDKHLTEHQNTVYLSSQATRELGGYPGHPLVEAVPPLAPGASARFKELCAHATSSGFMGHSGGFLKVFAEMPLDADRQPNDETATIVTHVVDGWSRPDADFNPAGFARTPFACGASTHSNCQVSGTIDDHSCAAQPGNPCGGQSYPCTPSTSSCTPCTPNTTACSPCTSNTSKCGATSKVVHAPASRRPTVLGSIGGSVGGGKTGNLSLRLNRSGLRLLRAHHTLRARLVLKVSSDGTAQPLVVAVKLVLKR